MIITIKDVNLLDTRLAYSPLTELAISRHAFFYNKLNSMPSRWLDEAQQAMQGTKLPYFDALVGHPSYVPDFLTPTPNTIIRDIDDALEIIRTTDHEIVHADIQTLIRYCAGAESEMLHHFLVCTQDALDCLVQEMRFYWVRTLAPYWGRVQAILEGDVLYRARKMALNGKEEVFRNLSSNLVYTNEGEIQIHKKDNPSFPSDYHVDLDGKGLHMVPAVLTGNHFYWQIESQAFAPMLIYTSRGAGNLWAQPVDPHPALETLLGAGRASVLQSLIMPSNTGEIATRLHMTAGALSQHLGKLREAGLVEPHRNGRWVYHHLTERGEQFIALFAS